MNLPEGYESRVPTENDLAAVSDLLIADQSDLTEQPLLGIDFIRGQWSWQGFELSEDAWIVLDETGAIVAYGQVRLEGPNIAGSWGAVHPDHRGRAIGSWMLDQIEARAAELLAGISSPRFRHAIDAGNGPAASLLGLRGLRPVRHFWHMKIDLATPVELGPAPEGIEIDTVDPRGDLEAIYTVLGGAIADDWREHPGVKPAGGWIGAGCDELRWPRPVRPGDTLRTESQALEMRPLKSRPDQGLVKMRTVTLNQMNEEVQIMVSNLLVQRRLPATQPEPSA